MRTGVLALFACFLSCQTATQITVKLRGVGVTCPAGASPTIEQTGVLAKRQLQSPADMSELSVLGEECAVDGSVVSLGDIVLVPADGPGPVEVLALGALKIGDAAAVSADDCRAEYERLFGAPCEIGEGFACESCIFARRSIAFVKHSKLEVTIDLEAACAGIICDPSKTCSQGVCVSAETSCEGEAPCGLVNEQQGGAGGEGAGGDGAGGQGGGGTDPWFPLWEPPMEECPGADPSDIIGAVVENGDAPRLSAFVPAGPCMIVLEEGLGAEAVLPAQNGNVNAYRAVAQGANAEIIAFGDLGVARSQTSFSMFSTSGLGNFEALVGGTSWDVASFASASNTLAWTRSYLSGGAHVEPFPPTGLQTPLQNAALFAVFPSEAPTQPVTFAAYGSVIAAFIGGKGVAESANATPLGWSLWAAERVDQPGFFTVVAVGSNTNAIQLGHCQATDSAVITCPGGFDIVSSNPATRQVVAIWGLQGSTGIDLYAVGQDNGQGPWLGRATLPGGNGEDLAWTFAGLPSTMASGASAGVTSVWAGRSAALDDVLMVVGPAGVFKAHIDDLEFLPEP